MSPRPLAVLPLAFALAALPGCYKGQMEAEKVRADAAEAKARELEAQVQAAKAAGEQVRQQFEQLKAGGALVTIVGGQVDGRDQIRFVPERNEFVRHGTRVRKTSVVRYENGALADQRLTVTREDGKPNFEGDIRAQRPEGEWIWYSKDGKPATKEIWQAGRLTDVQNASIARDGKVTWKSVSKAERDAWARTTAPVFMNLPELIRDTTPPTPPAPPAPPTGTGAKAPAGPGAPVAPKGTTTPKAPASSGKK